MDDGCFKPRPAKYGESRPPMPFFFRSLMPAAPEAKLELLPHRPRASAGDEFISPTISPAVLRAWQMSPAQSFMAPLAYVYITTNRQTLISRREGPEQVAEGAFLDWLARNITAQRSTRIFPPPTSSSTGTSSASSCWPTSIASASRT